MHTFEHIIFRGDHAAYVERDGRFPYVDHAAQAGATGIHIWFWKRPYLAVKDRFISYCHGHGLSVHLGIGVGAYGVCNGKDPTDPAVRSRIEAHIARTLDEQDVDGLEFQMGEYDWMEYRGESSRGKTMARQVVDALNPIVDFSLRRKPSLWIRTELWRIHFAAADDVELSRDLDRRCTVEWSDRLGPFRGKDALEKGRRLLAVDPRFSWFLKLHGLRPPAALSAEQARLWIEEWRGWVRLLHEFRRPTLTILNQTEVYASRPLPRPAVAVALARDPEMGAERALSMLFP